MRARERYEATHSGGFTRIYPVTAATPEAAALQLQYENLLEMSTGLFQSDMQRRVMGAGAADTRSGAAPVVVATRCAEPVAAGGAAAAGAAAAAATRCADPVAALVAEAPSSATAGASAVGSLCVAAGEAAAPAASISDDARGSSSLSSSLAAPGGGASLDGKYPARSSSGREGRSVASSVGRTVLGSASPSSTPCGARVAATQRRSSNDVLQDQAGPPLLARPLLPTVPASTPANVSSSGSAAAAWVCQPMPAAAGRQACTTRLMRPAQQAAWAAPNSGAGSLRAVEAAAQAKPPLPSTPPPGSSLQRQEQQLAGPLRAGKGAAVGPVAVALGRPRGVLMGNSTAATSFSFGPVPCLPTFRDLGPPLLPASAVVSSRRVAVAPVAVQLQMAAQALQMPHHTRQQTPPMGQQRQALDSSSREHARDRCDYAM